MIPAGFDYVRARTTEHALDLLEEHPERSRLLSGGHSLLPSMKARVVGPGVLVDISRLSENTGITLADGILSIGSAVSHRRIESDPLVRDLVPLLAHSASTIGDRQVRARGTIGGSVAHASPAGDLPTALTALDASIVVTSRAGERVVPIGEFFTGNEQNVLGPVDVVSRIDVPVLPGTPWAYQKFRRRHQEWGVVLVAALGGSQPRIALGNMHEVPMRARASEDAWSDGASSSDAAALVDQSCDAPDDVAAASDYRRHLARVLTARSIEQIRREEP